MFKLHDGLPYDVLTGHRDRFSGLFLKLKDFYNNVRPLQYFKDLIVVPELPESSPNFKSQNDFTSYVPPVVHVPQEPDPVVEDLVDTNNVEAEAYSQAQQQLSVLEGIISEKEAGIEELSFKLVALQKNFDELEESYRHDVEDLQKNNTILANDLALSREMCANMRMQNDELELQINQNPILMRKDILHALKTNSKTKNHLTLQKRPSKKRKNTSCLRRNSINSKHCTPKFEMNIFSY